MKKDYAQHRLKRQLVLLFSNLGLAIFFIFLSSAVCFAQEVRGKVTDPKGSPIPDATVLVKGTKSGVSTDANGIFTVKVPNSKSVLIISSVGFQQQEITVGNQTNLNVTLSAGSEQLTDVVVVGYGTQKKVTVTGAVSQVKGSDLQKSPTLNLSNALAGRLPGITAVQSSGEPGRDGSTIRIRGTNTLGNSDALIVIDGVPDRAGGLERLNPADIESMSVLKDASAAIYGARAANGVILITTKHGKSGKTALSYDFNQGWAKPTVIPKMSTAPEYAEMNNELVLFNQVPAPQWDAAWAALLDSGTYIRTDNGAVVNAPYQPEAIQKYKDGSDPWGYPNTDWFKATLKEWSPQSRHNLQITGGSENIKYLASLGYINQEAIYKNSATGYKQYDMRINVDARVNKYINTSVGLTVREEYRFHPTSSVSSIFRMLIRGKPTETAIWPNGLPGPDIENGENPVVITTNQTGYDKDKRDYFQTNGKVEITIPGIEGLKLTGMAALDKFIQRNKVWSTPWYLYFWDRKTYEADGKTPKLTKNIRSTFTDPRLSESDETRLNINLTGLINYDRIFGNHTLNFLAGVTRETIDDDNFTAYRRYYISTTIDQLFAGGDVEKNATGGAYKRSRLSYFGRVGYNYKEKYLAEFVWRYDGSYIFPPKGRFGFFPGILAGWRISEEGFWKDNITFIDNLKLRASWGQMGAEAYYDYNRDGIPDLVEYQYLSTYGFGRYVIGNQVSQTLGETRVINPSFTWEVANNTNVGLEGSLLNRRLSFEFDYFYNKRTNILWRRQGSTPASAGINTLLPPENIGKIENKGWEFKVGYGDRISDLRFTVSVNGGYAKNKILFYDEQPGAPEWQKATGHPFGTGSDDGTAFLAYQYDGVFKDLKEIATNPIDYSRLTGALRPGDMKFKDINHDNKINGDDQVRLDKTGTPKFTGGVNINLQYRNFDCSILFQGATGGLLWIRGAQEGDFGNYLQYTYDHRWSVNNQSSVDPRVSNRNDTYYTGGGAGNNTYYLRNADYLRLKNVEIGYNLPERLGKIAGISNLRVYVGGLNLITWDKMKLWDPESTSGNGYYYPQSKIINTGVRVTF